MLSADDVASITHEANRAYQLATGDPAPSPHWDDAPDWQRDSAIQGVIAAAAGRTPEQSHEGWLEHKRATGWTYGTVKDETARTHPCMVPYADLPPEQQMKDHLFVAIVGALCGLPPVVQLGEVQGGTTVASTSHEASGAGITHYVSEEQQST